MEDSFQSFQNHINQWCCFFLSRVFENIHWIDEWRKYYTVVSVQVWLIHFTDKITFIPTRLFWNHFLSQNTTRMSWLLLQQRQNNLPLVGHLLKWLSCGGNKASGVSLLVPLRNNTLRCTAHKNILSSTWIFPHLWARPTPSKTQEQHGSSPQKFINIGLYVRDCTVSFIEAHRKYISWIRLLQAQHFYQFVFLWRWFIRPSFGLWEKAHPHGERANSAHNTPNGWAWDSSSLLHSLITSLCKYFPWFLETVRFLQMFCCGVEMPPSLLHGFL